MEVCDGREPYQLLADAHAAIQRLQGFYERMRAYSGTLALKEADTASADALYLENFDPDFHYTAIGYESTVRIGTRHHIRGCFRHPDLRFNHVGIASYRSKCFRWKCTLYKPIISLGLPMREICANATSSTVTLRMNCILVCLKMSGCQHNVSHLLVGSAVCVVCLKEYSCFSCRLTCTKIRTYFIFCHTSVIPPGS